MAKITIGSLFSGIGGIEIGFESEDTTTLWFIEKDEHARSIFKERYPSASIYEDITQIDFKKMPKVDVITGGFPCQDISNAGKRAGIKGSQSSLWKYYASAIDVLRPKIAFIENVSSLRSRGLKEVLEDLAKIGYDAEWHCLSASIVGSPTPRDRIFIIAYNENTGILRWNGGKEETDPELWGEIRSKDFQWDEYESQFFRTGDGVSKKLDKERVKRLGNSVIPAQARLFAEAIFHS